MAGASLGALLAAGSDAARAADYNNDGFDDLAIGAVHRTVEDSRYAGIVNVLYGRRQGLSRSGEVWSQATDRDGVSIKGNPGPEDEFGSSLASGDFDNDGIDDLVIGVPGEGGYDELGAVNVIYGSRTGLTARRNQILRDNNPEQFDFFGASLAAGNFGGGAADDLAVGVPKENTGTGAVQVFAGSSDGLRSGSRKVLEEEDPSNHDNFGTALAAGDFGRTDYDDLGVGVPGFDWGTEFEDNDGTATVFYGSDNGLRSGYRLSPGFFTSGPAAFGSALAAGNLYGGGRDELAVGEPGWGDNGGIATYSPGKDGFGSGFPSSVFLNETTGGDRFGAAVAIGDYAGDRYEDLVGGAPEWGAGGAIQVHLGSEDGLLNSDRAQWSQHDTEHGENGQGDRFGRALAMGRFDGGRKADIAVGTAFEDLGSMVDAGQVTVFYSGPFVHHGGPSEPGKLYLQDDVAGEPKAGDRFGYAVH